MMDKFKLLSIGRRECILMLKDHHYSRCLMGDNATSFYERWDAAETAHDRNILAVEAMRRTDLIASLSDLIAALDPTFSDPHISRLRELGAIANPSHHAGVVAFFEARRAERPIDAGLYMTLDNAWPMDGSEWFYSKGYGRILDYFTGTLCTLKDAGAYQFNEEWQSRGTWQSQHRLACDRLRDMGLA